MKKMIVCLAAAVSFVWAGAMSSNVTLYQASTLNGVELKPGEYKVQVDGDKGDGKIVLLGAECGPALAERRHTQRP